MKRAIAGRWMIITAAILGFLGVALGALGSHTLSDILNEKSLQQFEIGVRYHFLHALALFGVGLLSNQIGSSRVISIAAVLMLAGVLLFSGSLYGLAVLAQGWLVFITPIGGMLLLVAWLTLLVGLIRYDGEQN